MSTYAAYSLLFAPNVLILLAVFSVILWLLKRKKQAVVVLLLGALWVLAWSLPITTLVFGGYLESRYPSLPAQEYPEVDAIVVLGGHIQGNRHNWFEPYDRQRVVSRESVAAELFHANRASLILLSGGALEGNISDTAKMARSLRQMGVPQEAIVMETESQNTLENAQLTDQTLKRLHKQRILLVTSALHMPRAMTAFSDQLVSVTPAPLPTQINWPQDRDRSVWMPDMHTLLASQTVIKEYAGLVLYWLHSFF